MGTGEPTTTVVDAGVWGEGPADQMDRRHLLRRGAVLAGAAGLALGGLGLQSVVASASATSDAKLLTAAASVENALLTVYAKVGQMAPSLSGAGNQVVAAYMTTAVAHHRAHLQSINGQLVKLGSTAVSAADSKLVAGTVTPGLAGIQRPSDVVALLLQLEQYSAEVHTLGAQTLTQNSAQANLAASIAPIEAQHITFLLAAQSVFQALAPMSLLQLPPPLNAVTSAAGSVAVPNAFFPTDQADAVIQGSEAG